MTDQEMTDQERPALIPVVFNTVSFLTRKIGHEIDPDKWKDGTVLYGYGSEGSSWSQKCAREECPWYISIEKEWDISQRIVFIIRAIQLYPQLPLFNDIKDQHDLFEIVIGPEEQTVDQYIKQHQMFPFDEKVLTRFILGSKSYLCKRLTNFV